MSFALASPMSKRLLHNLLARSSLVVAAERSVVFRYCFPRYSISKLIFATLVATLHTSSLSFRFPPLSSLASLRSAYCSQACRLLTCAASAALLAYAPTYCATNPSNPIANTFTCNFASSAILGNTLLAAVAKSTIFRELSNAV